MSIENQTLVDSHKVHLANPLRIIEGVIQKPQSDTLSDFNYHWIELHLSANKPSKAKAAGNILGWTISVISGLFTLVEFLVPKGFNAPLFFESLGIQGVTTFISLLHRWYVKYTIFALFAVMILFFVFPREEEKVTEIRRKRSARKKNYGRQFSNGSNRR